MPQFVSGVVAVLLRVASGTSELQYATEVNAEDGWYTLTLGQVDFAGGEYGLTTRGYTEAITFRLKPGGTLSITLENDLESANNVDCATTGTEYCKAGTTNFHTHGLHVSSKGTEDGLDYASDDIFVSVSPGSSNQFQFSIPDYHMGGTHWYHPHLHHATALQAGGGAAGVIIVEDPVGYLPDVYSSMVEKILFISGHNLVTLQEIAEDAQSNVLEDAVTKADSAALDTNVFLVNGQLGTTMSIDSHVWHRLRMIYAAVEQTLTVTAVGDATCQLQLLAKDGIYLNEIPRGITTIYLYPGARADVAMSCTCTAYPCEAELTSGGGRRLQRGGEGQAQPGRRLQGQGGAGPDDAGMDVAAVTLMTISVTETVGGVVETLPTTALDRPCYLADLREATVPNGQSGTLALNGGQRAVTWDGAGTSMTSDAIEAVGGMSNWDALTSFTTGTVYELEVTGANAHPLHTHVNPFQIQDMGGATELDDGYFQAGDWHDALYLDSLGQADSLTVRMNTDFFTGKMVIHCHILSHEDEGMMAYIDLTGTEGAVFADAKTLDPSCYDAAYASAPTPAPPPTPAPTPTSATTMPTTAPSPTPAPCADDDDQIIALASQAGQTISGCVVVESYCEDPTYGSVVQATCPETCGLCCEDDDDQIIALASQAGLTISGCVVVESYCEHPTYGSVVQATCPATCGSCTAPGRRLADGKVSSADEFDRIDELTVVAPSAEVSNSDTNIFYP